MFTRTIDCLGRITIPKDIRDALDMPVGTDVSITYQNDFVTIKKASNDPYKSVENAISTLEESELKNELMCVFYSHYSQTNKSR